ncbi:MAG: hypothetical protein ACK4TA_18700 [Saprospiraceae bacterium]
MKNRITLWMGMLGIFIALTAQAQNAKLRTLGITYGYQHYSRQDQLFSPLVYNGTAPLNLQLSYNVNTANSQQNAYLSFGMYNMSAHEAYDFTEDFDGPEERTLYPSSFQLIRLGYGYARKFGNDQKLVYSAGLRLDGQIEAMFFEMGFASVFGYTTTFALAPSISAEYYFNRKTSLSGQLAVPVLGFVARSPYALNDDDYIERQSSHNNLTTIVNLIGDSDLRSFGTYRQVDVGLHLQHQFTPNTALRLGWQARWYEITEPKRVLALQNGFNAGLQFKL